MVGDARALAQTDGRTIAGRKNLRIESAVSCSLATIVWSAGQSQFCLRIFTKGFGLKHPTHDRVIVLNGARSRGHAFCVYILCTVLRRLGRQKSRRWLPTGR